MNNLKSYTEYAVTNPTTDFVIGFDFNYGTDAVNITVDDVPATEAGYTVIYLNSTTMRLNPAVPSGVVRLQRETDIDVQDNQFTAGAKFNASNMDENFTQVRKSQQEVRDGFEKLSEDTYEIIDTLQVVGQAAQDAADAAEQAAQTANDAAAQVNDKVSKSTTLPTYLTVADGVNPVTGVADGAYFNVRSSSDDSYVDEYQNVGGNAVATGKSYPSGNYVETIAEYTALPFKQGKSYALYERLQLDNGDIVKSTINGNTNNPNINTLNWWKETHTVNLRQFFISGDGTDETTKLQNAIDFCIANGVDVIDADNMRIKTTATITINKAIKIINNLQIDCYHDQIGLLCRPTATNFYVSDSEGGVLDLDFSVFRNQYYDTPTAVGAQIWNAYKGVFRYNHALRHYDGLQLRADRNSGVSYCEFYLGSFKSCSGGILIKEVYEDGGWVTENTFYKGNFGGGLNIRSYLRYHIKLDGGSLGYNNSNVFIQPSFEGFMTHGIVARVTQANTFISPRFEMPYAVNNWDFDNTCQNMSIFRGFGVGTAISEGKYFDESYYSVINASSQSTQGAFDLIGGTIYEYVSRVRNPSQSLAPTAARKRVSVGFKTQKEITHNTSGSLTIDISEADVFRISVSANLTSINFENANLLQPYEEKQLVFIQNSADLVVTPFSSSQLGSFSNPISRQNSQHIYTLQRMAATTGLSVASCATNIDVNSAITHTSSGALSINVNRGELITVNANADITSLVLSQSSNMRIGDQRTISFVQGATGVSINAFSPQILGQGRSNPASRANGIDVYELKKLANGSLVCTGSYHS